PERSDAGQLLETRRRLVVTERAQHLGIELAFERCVRDAVQAIDLHRRETAHRRDTEELLRRREVTMAFDEGGERTRGMMFRDALRGDGPARRLVGRREADRTEIVRPARAVVIERED